MARIIYEGKNLGYELHLAERRKTIALRVDRDGRVIVRAPRHIKKNFVKQFVQKKSDWILEKQRYFEEMRRKYPPKEFKNGETFPLLGRNYRLRVVKSSQCKHYHCKIEDKRLKVFVDGQTGDQLKERIKGAVQEWYVIHTEKKAREIINKHAPSLTVTLGSIKAVEQSKRWGSCSKKGNIRLNWRLSMMPIPMFEYVIVHELCHLKTHDHSARFWQILKSILPDYETRRTWFRDNSLSFMQLT